MEKALKTVKGDCKYKLASSDSILPAQTQGKKSVAILTTQHDSAGQHQPSVMKTYCVQHIHTLNPVPHACSAKQRFGALEGNFYKPEIKRHVYF